jgi:hypothetical protein
MPNDPEPTLVHREVDAATIENEYRASKGLPQLPDCINGLEKT